MDWSAAFSVDYAHKHAEKQAVFHGRPLVAGHLYICSLLLAFKVKQTVQCISNRNVHESSRLETKVL